MTPEEAQLELDRILPVNQKTGAYVNALYKIINEAKNPPPKIEDLKAEAESAIKE